jgi:hypothetical protein
MPEHPEKPAIVGEDGELIQPDMTVDPDVYAEFVATHVHRDPLMFRLRENVRENIAVYQLISLPFSCVFTALIPLLFLLSTGQIDWETNHDAIIQAFIIIFLVATVPVGLIYLVLHTDTRQ